MRPLVDKFTQSSVNWENVCLQERGTSKQHAWQLPADPKPIPTTCTYLILKFFGLIMAFPSSPLFITRTTSVQMAAICTVTNRSINCCPKICALIGIF